MSTRFSLPRFVRPSRPGSSLQITNQDDLPPLPSSGDPDTQLDHPDRQTILSRRNTISHDHIELLRGLVDVEANRNLALEFIGNDASIVINTIAKALKASSLQSTLALHSFSLLRELAGETGQLPDSYLVSKHDYEVEATVFASGGFADIRKGKLGKRAVAVKTIRVPRDRDIPKIQKDFCKESVLWMQLSHPNILELLAVDMDRQSRTFSLISELMVNGNIMEYIRVKNANRIHLLEDVTRGLQYLHEREIIHGDIKGINILIKNEATPRACIFDFSCSTVDPTVSSAMLDHVDELKGTWSHMAPELLFPAKFGQRDASPISKLADIYAFGVTVYEVLVGRNPYGGNGVRVTEHFMRIIEGKGPSKPEKADDIGFGEGTWELVQRCWHQNRDKRPTVEDIHKHFHRVARSSVVVPPGHAPLAPEADCLESSSTDFAQLFAHSSQISASIVQQTKFVADVTAGGGSLHSAVSVPSVQLIRAKPSLFDRLGARIKGRRPALGRIAPAFPPARD